MKVLTLFSNWEKENGIVYRCNCKVNFSEIEKKGIDRWVDSLFGNYAFCMEQRDEVILIVDSIRSMPIFYSVDINANQIIVSNNANTIATKTNKAIELNRKREFLSTGYCFDNHSLYNDIYQVLPGNIVRINKNSGEICTVKYIDYSFKNCKEFDIDILCHKFDEILLEVFYEYKKHIGDCQILVPLSGGLDSRTIAYYLKKTGFSNIVCFTYGNKNLFEVKNAQIVANELGLTLHTIEYNKESWELFWKSDISEEFIIHSCMGSEIGCIQALPAMLNLKERNIIEDDAVVMPGHALDFLAGGHLPNVGENEIWTVNKFKDKIIQKNCFINKKYVIKKQDISCTANGRLSKQDIIQNYYTWEINNRQSKFIANDVRAYEFFGCDFCLPFWDKRIVEFFMNLPYEMLLARKFQVIFMKKTIDKELSVKTDYYQLASNDKFFKFILKKILRAFLKSINNKRIEKRMVEMKDDNVDAFYSFMTKEQYENCLTKYGIGFSLNTIVAEKSISFLEGN